MTRAEMLLEKMRRYPPDMPLAQVQAVLVHLGWTLARTRKLHFHYVREGDLPISIPSHEGYVKPTYLRQILDRQ